MTDDKVVLQFPTGRRRHNVNAMRLTYGMPAQPASAESEADPQNPNREPYRPSANDSVPSKLGG